jgi:hypothetical protein
MHATIVVLQDLIDRPTSDHAATSRLAIDVVFALCAEKGGLVATAGQARPLTEGGEESWGFLRHLRVVAWRKAGLDPRVILTREQATEVAISTILYSEEASTLGPVLPSSSLTAPMSAADVLAHKGTRQHAETARELATDPEAADVDFDEFLFGI